MIAIITFIIRRKNCRDHCDLRPSDWYSDRTFSEIIIFDPGSNEFGISTQENHLSNTILYIVGQ